MLPNANDAPINNAFEQKSMVTLTKLNDNELLELEDLIKYFLINKEISESNYTGPILKWRFGLSAINHQYAATIFPINKDGAIIRNNSTGSHPVTSLKGAHYKFRPVNPGNAFAAHSLALLINSQNTTPCELLKFKSSHFEYHVLATKTVQGDRFDQKLKNVKESSVANALSAMLANIDRTQFGLSLLHSWLIEPNDNKDENFILTPISQLNNQNNEIKTVLNNFDAEECFAEPIYLSGNKHKLDVRDIQYLLPIMEEQVPESFYQAIAKFSAPELLMSWLCQIQTKNNEYLRLKEEGIFTEEDLTNLNLPIKFKPGQIGKMYCKLNILIKLAKAQANSSQQLTWAKLFEKMDPLLAKIYKVLRQRFPLDPQAAYQIAHTGELEEVFAQEQEIISELEKLKLTKSPPIFQDIQQSFEELISQFDHSEFNNKEDILHLLQKAMPVKHLTIKNNNALTGALLQELMSCMQGNLKKLTLIGCQDITEDILERITAQFPHLDLTVSKSMLDEVLPAWRSRCKHFTLAFADGGMLPISQNLDQQKELLLSAVNQQSLEAVDYLLKRDFDPNAKIFGTTPLHKAAQLGNVNIFTALLAKSYNLEVCDNQAQTALSKAFSANPLNLIIIEALLHAGARWDSPQDGVTAFHTMFAKCSQAEIAQLTSNWSQQDWTYHFNLKDAFDRTAVHYAAKNQHQNIITLCHNHGASLDIGDSTGTTPLHFAVNASSAFAADELLSFGAYLHKNNNAGKSPYTLLINKNDPAIKDVFARYVVNPAQQQIGNNSQNNLYALLDYAKQGNHAALPAVLNELQQAVQNQQSNLTVQSALQLVDNRGRTALHWASRGPFQNSEHYNNQSFFFTKLPSNIFTTTLNDLIDNYTKVIQKLCEAGANINAVDNYGNTPLLQAAESSNSVEIIKKLIELGADITAKNNERRNIFHLITSQKRNRNTILYYLIEKLPAILAERDKLHRQNPRDINYFKQQIYYLINDQDKSGNQPIHYACAKGEEPYQPGDQLRTVQLLLRQNLQINFNDARENLLHKVMQANPSLAIIQEILAYFVNTRAMYINERNRRGETPLHYLIQKANNEPNSNAFEELVRYLIAQGANIDLKDNQGRTPRALVANLPLKKVMEEAVAMVNQRNEQVADVILTDRINFLMRGQLAFSKCYQALVADPLNIMLDKAKYEKLFNFYRDIFQFIFIKDAKVENMQNIEAKLVADFQYASDKYMDLTNLLREMGPKLSRLRQRYERQKSPRSFVKFYEYEQTVKQVDKQRDFFNQINSRINCYGDFIRSREQLWQHYQNNGRILDRLISAELAEKQLEATRSKNFYLLNKILVLTSNEAILKNCTAEERDNIYVLEDTINKIVRTEERDSRKKQYVSIVGDNQQHLEGELKTNVAQFLPLMQTLHPTDQQQQILQQFGQAIQILSNYNWEKVDRYPGQQLIEQARELLTTIDVASDNNDLNMSDLKQLIMANLDTLLELSTDKLNFSNEIKEDYQQWLETLEQWLAYANVDVMLKVSAIDNNNNNNTVNMADLANSMQSGGILTSEALQTSSAEQAQENVRSLLEQKLRL